MFDLRKSFVCFIKWWLLPFNVKPCFLLTKEIGKIRSVVKKMHRIIWGSFLFEIQLDCMQGLSRDYANKICILNFKTFCFSWFSNWWSEDNVDMSLLAGFPSKIFYLKFFLKFFFWNKKVGVENLSCKTKTRSKNEIFVGW